MDKMQMKQLESDNDGQTFHLFYDDIVGLYFAFGLSAYYTMMVVDPFISYVNIGFYNVPKLALRGMRGV